MNKKSTAKVLPIAKKLRPFWSNSFSKSGELTIKIDYNKYIEVLESYGIYRVKKLGSKKDLDVRLVKLENNIIEEISKGYISTIFRNQFKENKSISNDEYSQLISKYNKLLSDSTLIALKELKPQENRAKSTKNITYTPFKNGVVRTTKKDSKIIPFKDIDGYYWKHEIINREFKLNPHNCFESNFYDFICKVSSEDQENPDKENINRFIRTFGYLCHNYSAPTNKAVILNDMGDHIDRQADGGRGKGIFISGVKEMNPSFQSENGGNWNPNDKFAFASYKENTSIIAIDDIPNSFDFRALFSSITDGLKVEKKGLDKFEISAWSAPKFIISTNYTIIGISNSHTRRRINLEFSDYFKQKNGLDYFGKHLFDEWSDDEWSQFYNFAFHCLKQYHKFGLMDDTEKFKKKQLLLNIPESYREPIQDLIEDQIASGQKEKFYFTTQLVELIENSSNIKIKAAKSVGIWLRQGEKIFNYKCERVRRKDEYQKRQRGYLITLDGFDESENLKGDSTSDDLPF